MLEFLIMNYKEDTILDTFINKKGDLSIDKFLIVNNVLFRQGIIKHEIAKNEDGIIFIKMDTTNKKHAIKLINYCLKNNITEDKIILLTDIFPEKNNVPHDIFHRDNIISMLEIYTEEDSFYKFKKMNFNFMKSLSYNIKYYGIYDLFKEFCKKTLEHRFTGMEYKYTNYYTWSKRDWIIENEEIRKSITNLHRKVKIYIMLEKEIDNNG